MTKEATLEKVLTCPNLPSLPTVATEVLELTRDPNVHIDAIATVVQNDQALTGKILRTVNSSFYGLSISCPNIKRALAYLGLNTVKSLILGFSLVDLVEDDGRFCYKEYWRRSLYSATAARLHAMRTESCDPDEAFVAALLQDVGMLAMHVSLRDEYDAIVAAHQHTDLPKVERRVFRFDHAEIGAKLAKKWRLPDILSETIRYHHQPDKASKAHRSIIREVVLATIAVEALEPVCSEPALQTYKDKSAEWFSLDEQTANDVMLAAAESASELSRLFQLDTGEKADMAAIQASASEALLEHQVSVGRESEQLRTSNSELTRQTRTDGLTGIANRKWFDDMIKTCFEQVEQEESDSVAVLFCDADKFKSVNDTYGHQAGDAVLVELATRMGESIGDSGTICRYGGEEFAIIMPETTLPEALELAECIRALVVEQSFDLREIEEAPDRLELTVSIGVAAHSPESTRYDTPEDLVAAADRGVYEAKESGRNRVCEGKPTTDENHECDTTETVETEKSPQKSAMPTFRVLVIENDPLVRSLIEKTFHVLSHCEVRLVDSAETAMKLLVDETKNQSWRPNLILCEADLPGASGIELTKAVRSAPVLALTPIIILTATEQPDKTAECLQAGANACISRSRLGEDIDGHIFQMVDFWSEVCRAA